VLNCSSKGHTKALGEDSFMLWMRASRCTVILRSRLPHIKTCSTRAVARRYQHLNSSLSSKAVRMRPVITSRRIQKLRNRRMSI
jgi:hypothetical protein